MRIKRSWCRRLAVVLSAVMIVSSASPISAPVMAADDTAQETVLDQSDAADGSAEDIVSVPADENMAGTGNGEELSLTAEGEFLEADDVSDPVTSGEMQEYETDESTGLVDENDSSILEPDGASDGSYSGALRLNTQCFGLARKIGYKFDEGGWQYLDITTDGVKPQINFTGVKKVTFKLADVVDDLQIIKYSGNAYKVSFAVDGNDDQYSEEQSTYVKKYIENLSWASEVVFDLKEIGFRQNGILKFNVNAEIERNCRKKGNLIIHVASENRIAGTDKVISINKVNVRLGDYAIAYDVSGNIVADKYRTGVSVNEIAVSGYGGTITLPYWCAKDATIEIDDPIAWSGNEGNGTRYAYTIGDQYFYSKQARVYEAEKKKCTVNLAVGLDVDTHIYIGVKQASFEPVIKFTTVSNNIITGFDVKSKNDDETYSHISHIDASSDADAKSVVLDSARRLGFHYDLFSTTGTASSEFKRDSGNDKNWVYRIDYKDTEGREVSKSLIESGDEFEIEIDGNDRFPEEIRVSAIPKVKVTLSANSTKQYKRDENKILKDISWNAENGQRDSGVASNGKYSFWVEPGRTVQISNIKGKEEYIFPYIEGAAQVYEGKDSVLQFTLPEITEDRVFDVPFYEFDLDNKSLITVTNGLRLYDGQPGKAGVSINGIDGYGVTYDNETSSQLCGHKVLKLETGDLEDPKKQIEVSIKIDQAESFEYSFERISYDCYDFYDQNHLPVKPIKKELDNSFDSIDPDNQYETSFKVISDGHGNRVATVYIPLRRVLFKLVKDGKFELSVVERELRRQSLVALSEGMQGTLKTASVQVGGEYRYAINRAGYVQSGSLPYGTDVCLKAEPAAGFKLSGVVIECSSDSNKNETVTDEKKLAAFTNGTGYSYKLNGDVTVIFNTEPVYDAAVSYKTGSDKPELKRGKYSIDHRRPVLVQYRNGAASPTAYTCDIFIGSDKITSNEGIVKSGDIYTIDGTKGDLAGKNVTLKFYTGNGSSKDNSLKTVELVIDKADTGIKFGADKYSIPLGTDKEIPVSITGSFASETVFASDKTYDKSGLTVKLDASKKKLIFKSTTDSKPDIYTINIVNPNDPGVIYGSVKIELETETVKTAPAPAIWIVGTTNRGVTVGLKAKMPDTSVKGLYYELQIKTKDQKKGYFRTSRGVEAGDKIYVPVTASSKYVDMFTAEAASGSEYAGDPDALFAASARMIQIRSDKTAVAASDNWSDEKDGTFSTKEGERYETKLKLKKISTGTIYNTMSSGNAYRFSVVYSRNTSIQRLDHVELLAANGEEVDYPSGRYMSDYIGIEDDYTIRFHPGGTGSVKYDSHAIRGLRFLSPGTYIIKAYALEPDGLEVSASVKVKVEKGISGLNLDRISRVLYKNPGKNVSLQLTAFGTLENYDDFETKKVRFEIIDEKNTNGLVKINRNGKLTVNRKLDPDNTEFTVRITATDFARAAGTEEIFEDKTIKIRSAYDMADLNITYSKRQYLYPDRDELLFNKTGILGHSHYLSELTEADVLKEIKLATSWNYSPQFWISVFEHNEDDGKDYFVPVKFKISGAGKLVKTKSTQAPDISGAFGTCALIEITDVEKDIKITAYTADGSGRKIKDYKVRIKSAEGKLGVCIVDGYNTLDTVYINIADEPPNLLDWDFGNTDLTYDSYASERDGMGMIIGSEYYNEKILGSDFSAVKYRISSVKGGRIVKVNFYHTKIYPTAAKTTFTITDMTTKKDYKVTINNRGYADRSKKTKVTVSNKLYDAKNGTKAVDGVIYSHLDFSSNINYSDYDDVKWNTVTFHVDSAEDNQYVMVEVATVVKKVNGEYKAVTKPLGYSLKKLMIAQSEKEKVEGEYLGGIFRTGVSYPIKLTGKDFTVDFFDKGTNRFDIAPGSYRLTITPARREGSFRYRALACPATVTIKAVAPPKANVSPGTAVTFGTSEGTVTKGDYSNFIPSPVYKEQGILYKELRNMSKDGKMNRFTNDFRITDQGTGKIEYTGSDPIGINDKDRDEKLQGWLVLKYQKVDGTVVEEPVRIKIDAKGEIRKK